LISFVLMVIVSIFAFSTLSNVFGSLILTIISIILFTSITNIFYIVISDKVYLYTFLIIQTILFLFLHFIIGQGFAITSIFLIWISLLFFYLGYLELEKNQLSSRLFNISHICTEVTRILTTASILICCIGLFNQIVSMGTVNGEFASAKNFVNKVFLNDKNFIDNVLIGYNPKGKSNGLNSVFFNKTLVLKGDALLGANDEVATLKDFLTVNFNPVSVLLSPDRKDDIEGKCSREKIENCETLIDEEKNKNLIAWQAEAYPEIKDLPLTTPIKIDLYRTLTKQYLTHQVVSLSKPSEAGKAIPLPILSNLNNFSRYIIPTSFTLILFFSLIILKPLINGASVFFIWVLWSLLKMFKIVKIDIETVESEVVSI
jgi:hypothetical protein